MRLIACQIRGPTKLPAFRHQHYDLGVRFRSLLAGGVAVDPESAPQQVRFSGFNAGSGQTAIGQIRSATLPPNAATFVATAHRQIANYKPRE